MEKLAKSYRGIGLTSAVRFAPRSRRSRPRWIHRLLVRPPSGRFDRARTTPIVTVQTSFRATKAAALILRHVPDCCAERRSPIRREHLRASIPSFQHCHASHAKARPVRCCNIDGQSRRRLTGTTALSALASGNGVFLVIEFQPHWRSSTRCQPDNLRGFAAFYCSTFRFCMGGHGFIWGRPQRELH